MAPSKRIPSRSVPSLAHLKNELGKASDANRAKNLAWFFKTGKGEYGEGDRFCGITVPALREIASRYRDLKLSDMKKLLGSPIHEHRLAALLILVDQYKRVDALEREKIFDFYLANTRRINNWDLVDASARDIVGEHLLTRPRAILYELAKSSDLWERRVAIIATHAFIRRGDLADTFQISELLLGDKHDLIHKAVGWMLREAGKVSEPQLLGFIKTHYSAMPRTTLRYAIERMPEAARKRHLRGEFD